MKTTMAIATAVIARVRVFVLALAVLCWLCGAANAQLGNQRVQESILLTVSGTTATFFDSLGSTSDTFEYVITGAPATSSIVLKGCMRGGTCITIETFTDVVTNAIRYMSGSDYDNIQITWTFTGGTSPTLKINWSGSSGVGTGGIADPCQAPGILKQSSFVDPVTATTVALVAPVTGTYVYLCGFVSTMAGTITANTFKFVDGTGGTCGTGTITLSATFTSGILTSGATVVRSNGQGAIIRTRLGRGLCVTTTIATTPSINIHAWWVQM